MGRVGGKGWETVEHACVEEVNNSIPMTHYTVGHTGKLEECHRSLVKGCKCKLIEIHKMAQTWSVALKIRLVNKKLGSSILKHLKWFGRVSSKQDRVKWSFRYMCSLSLVLYRNLQKGNGICNPTHTYSLL